MKLFILIIWLMSSLLLMGCSHMNSTFDCPMKAGVRCESLDQVNKRVDTGEIGHDDVLNFSQNPTFISQKNQTIVTHRKVQEPLRYGETVQHVWIAPFEDTAGNYHEASDVYTITRPGHWIGYPLKAMKDED